MIAAAEKRGRKPVKLEKLAELLLSSLCKENAAVFTAVTVLPYESLLIICLSCLSFLNAVPWLWKQHRSVCFVYFNLLNSNTLPSAGSVQCSRFRKITRGEWLTRSLFYVTKGSCHITEDSRLGETIAGLRLLRLEQTRNWEFFSFFEKEVLKRLNKPE